jgi:hypothetical protein
MTETDDPKARDASGARVDRRWIEAIRGKTVRFSFHEGPTKGASYDHLFHDDGTVSWSDASSTKRGETTGPGSSEAKKEPPTRYGSFQVTDDVYVVSYLSKSGYTLTLALNFETDELFGFASNDQHWYPVRGIFEIIE